MDAELRKRLDERNAEMETAFYLLVTEREAADIAGGYVSNRVKGMARTMLDFREEDERKAQAAAEEHERAKAKKPRTRPAEPPDLFTESHQ